MSKVAVDVHKRELLFKVGYLVEVFCRRRNVTTYQDHPVALQHCFGNDIHSTSTSGQVLLRGVLMQSILLLVVHLINL